MLRAINYSKRKRDSRLGEVIMVIKRWDPFRDLALMSELIDNSFNDEWPATGVKETRDTKGAWTPAVDIMEAGDCILISAELPGMEKEDVSLEIKERALVISGERNPAHKLKEESYYQLERSYGRFYRMFKLPDDIDPADIKASLENGVLEVRLCRKPKLFSQKVTVEAGDKDA